MKLHVALDSVFFLDFLQIDFEWDMSPNMIFVFVSCIPYTYSLKAVL